jgi:hypothetical protein
VTVLVLFTVTGCFRYRSAAVIDETGTVSGSVIIGYSPDLIRMGEELNGPQSDPVADLRRFLEAGAASVSAGTAVVRPYVVDGFTGFETTFTDVATTDYLNLLRYEEQSGDSPDVLFQLDRRDGDYVFSAELEPARPDQMALPAKVFESVEITLSLTFPGPVSQANGEVSGNTVTWHPRLPDAPRLEAVGRATADTSVRTGDSSATRLAEGDVTEAGATTSDDGGPAVGVVVLLGAAAAAFAAAVAVGVSRWRRERKG